MPIIVQTMIYREDLQSNPEVLYAFGDNTQRSGFGGQAAQMRDEPNAVGIVTKHGPSYQDWAFFSDDQLEANKRMIAHDFQRIFKHLRQGGTIVWPRDGIGTGRARLREKAPETYAFLQELIDEMVRINKTAMENIKWVHSEA